MFDQNFTFNTSRSSSLDSASDTSSTREPSRSVSPCSPTGPFPPSRFSVTDLAASFASSRLRTDAQICYDSCEAYANMDDDAGWEIPSRDDDLDTAIAVHTRTMPEPSYYPSRRLQRQVNTRLLCSMTHAKNIASLVSQMVEFREQCTIVTSEAVNASSDEDEGYRSGETLTSDSRAESRRSSVAVSKSRLQYRRSSEFKTTSASISKAVRFRRGTQQPQQQQQQKKT